jgi:hypothetical protein
MAGGHGTPTPEAAAKNHAQFDSKDLQAIAEQLQGIRGEVHSLREELKRSAAR